MLLNEYDEQAVIQAIAKEAEEKGEKTGEMRGIAIGENKGEEKLGALFASMIQSRESQDALTKVSTDSDYREKMYIKYGIK